MPTTVNGIGTHYYGRKDQSVVQGNCPFCNRFTKLSSYETREWFCFVFIPLIPLRKFRILNDCAVCSKHHRVPLVEFKSRLENEITPLRAAAQRSPSDPAAWIALVEALIGFQMYSQAETEACEGLTALPRDARLNRLMAQLVSLRGDLPGATPFYRQAAAAAPEDGGIRFALGSHLLARGENAEAVRELGEAWRRDPANSQALYLMGEALFAEKRWNEALDAYQQLLMRHPDMEKDRDLLRRIKECKEALGFPLTDAERKAGRRWWPFGSKRRATAPLRPSRNVEGRRIGVLLAIVLGVIVVAGLGSALWKQRHDEVWFDNGLQQPVRITFNGDTFPLPPGPPVKKIVKSGGYPIVVTDAKGKEIERYTAQIAGLDLFDALVTDRLFVYNVAEAHIYQREEIGYAEAEANQTYKQTFVAFKRFFEQQDVDYTFEAPPDTIQVDSKSTTTVKVAFNVTQMDANDLGVAWFNEGKNREAEKAFRRALAAAPCAAVTRNNLLHILRTTDRQQEAADEARQWLTDCPEAGVEAHRAYQDTQIALGRRIAVEGQYETRLAQHPEVGANHYLLARLMDDPERSIPMYQEAVRLDPSLWWSRAALATDLLALERDAEALENLEQTLKLPGRDSSVAVAYAMAAIGAGATGRAREALKEGGKEEEDDDNLWNARWLLLLASGEDETAEKLLRAREKTAEERDPAIWNLRAQLLRVRRDEASLKRALREGRIRPEVAGLAGTIRQEEALGAGNWKEAMAAIDELKPEEISVLDRLYAAWALRMSGDAGGAAERLAALETELALAAREDTDSAALLAMVQHLSGRASGDAVLAAARRSGYRMVPHAWFVLGAAKEAAGDAAGARPLYERARQRALDLDVPYFMAAARAAPGGL